MSNDTWKEDYNWAEAFAFCGPDGSGYNADERKAYPTAGSKLEPREVRMADVAEVVAMSDGEHDERNWLGVFKLTDGSYLTLSAGCDYTGWDCHASGSGGLSETLAAAIRFGLSDNERERLGLRLDAVTP